MNANRISETTQSSKDNILSHQVPSVKRLTSLAMFSPPNHSLFCRHRCQQDDRISCGHSQIELLLHFATHFSPSSRVRVYLRTFYPDDHRPYPFNHTDERVIGRRSEIFDQWPLHICIRIVVACNLQQFHTGYCIYAEAYWGLTCPWRRIVVQGGKNWFALLLVNNNDRRK